MRAKPFLIYFFCLILLFFAVSSIRAQSNTDSTNTSISTPTTTAQPEATTGTRGTTIQNRIEKREEFKEKLQEIKNEKKRALVERIDTKISSVNTNRTTQMSTVLEKLNSILSRLIEKVNTAKTAGGNETTLAEVAITQAQSALSTAKASVASQASKQYDIQVSSEEGVLRTNVGSTVSQFEKDLRTTHKTVVDAKQALMSVIKELSKLKTASVSSTVISPTVPAE